MVALQVLALEVFDEFRSLLERAGFERLEAVPLREADVADAEELRRLMRLLRSEFRKDRLMRDRLLSFLENDEGRSLYQRQLLTALVKLYGGDDSYYLNFYGESATIPVIPYHLVLQNDEELDLNEKVVFVGGAELSSAEQVDAFNTVFRRADGVDLNGVEVAATAFANLLTDRSLVRRLDLHIGSLLLFGILAFALANLLRGARAVAAVMGLGTIYFGVVLLFFVKQSVLLPVFTPLALQLPLALLLGLFLQFSGEKLKSESYRRWVPHNVAEAPSQTGTVFGAVLRTDLEGSTALSDQISRESYTSWLGRYVDIVRESVVSFKGRVLGPKGDDLTCFWELKERGKDLHSGACRAALEILNEVDLFNQRSDENNRMVVRIGLHVGWVDIGPAGATGQVLNTVARIEGLNKLLSTRILASEEVAANLDGLLVRRLGSFLLKGKSKPVSIVEVMGLAECASETEHYLCQQFDALLATFEAHRWSEAVTMSEKILSSCSKDGPTHFYLDRTREYIAKGPPAASPHIIRITTK